MTPEKQIYDADQARLVLENEQFAAAMADIETEIWTAWKSSPVRDEEGRRELFRLLKSAEKFASMLKTRLETGKLAQLNLKQQAEMLAAERSIDTRGWSSPYL